ncbi:MAG TPA: response regulator transcription factor [Bryobacteraceae bacterium]|nr:response regulator transcription factor [Bryobacteraceae bacterium]
MKVLIETPEPILAVGAAAVLHQHYEVTVCNGRATAMEMISPDQASILVIDCAGPDDLAHAVSIRRMAPECRIILWVHDISLEGAFQVLGAGIRGILRKSLPVDDMLRCLERVAAGEVWVEHSLATGFQQAKAVNLTPRESELVALVSQGLKNKEIARALNISEATVRVYLSALFRKLGIKDRYELAIYGLRNMANLRNGSEAAGESLFPFRTIMVGAAAESKAPTLN